MPAVYTGDSDVFASRAAADWLCLLEAFEQPHRSGLVRAAATTMFFGQHRRRASPPAATSSPTRSPTPCAGWADHVRERGVAAVLEAASVARAWPRGCSPGAAASAT